VHPRHEIAARNLGWICAAPHDRADDRGFRGIGGCAGARRNRDSIAYVKVSLRCERFVDCDCSGLDLERRGRL
jgi:hypothetical protein